MNDEESLKLTDDQIHDVEETFNRLLRDVRDVEPDEVIREALQEIERHLDDQSIPERVRSGLEEGKSLASELYPNDLDNPVHRIALASLEYFRDPWDIIPDEIDQYGLLDDAYAFKFAQEKIDDVRKVQQELDEKEVRTEDAETGAQLDDDANNRPEEDDPQSISDYETEEILQDLSEDAGPHLAERAKTSDLLNARQRKALFDIGLRRTKGRDLSGKQKSYFVTLIEDLIQSGLSLKSCEESSCSTCSYLDSLTVDSA